MLGWKLLNPPQHPGQLTAGLRLSPMTDEQPGFSQPHQPTLVQARMSGTTRQRSVPHIRTTFDRKRHRSTRFYQTKPA